MEPTSESFGALDLMEGLPRAKRSERDWLNALTYSVQSPPVVVRDVVLTPASISSYIINKEQIPGYIPTNTTAPDYYGGHRHGDNLFPESSRWNTDPSLRYRKLVVFTTATSVAQPKRGSLQCNFYSGTRMRILAGQRNQTSFCSPIAAADFTWFSKLQKTVARTFMIRICQWGVPVVAGIYDRHRHEFSGFGALMVSRQRVVHHGCRTENVRYPMGCNFG